jgi:hypothetical protein
MLLISPRDQARFEAMTWNHEDLDEVTAEVWPVLFRSDRGDRLHLVRPRLGRDVEPGFWPWKINTVQSIGGAYNYKADAVFRDVLDWLSDEDAAKAVAAMDALIAETGALVDQTVQELAGNLVGATEFETLKQCRETSTQLAVLVDDYIRMRNTRDGAHRDYNGNVCERRARLLGVELAAA